MVMLATVFPYGVKYPIFIKIFNYLNNLYLYVIFTNSHNSQKFPRTISACPRLFHVWHNHLPQTSNSFDLWRVNLRATNGDRHMNKKNCENCRAIFCMKCTIFGQIVNFTPYGNILLTTALPFRINLWLQINQWNFL